MDRAVERVAEIIQAQLDTLPPSVAKAKRKELRQLAATVSRSSGRGKFYRKREAGVFVFYPNPAQNLHKLQLSTIFEQLPHIRLHAANFRPCMFKRRRLLVFFFGDRLFTRFCKLRPLVR